MIDMKIIENGAELLRRGELVIFPTETVYGLGADATNKKAIKKIYTLKSRPMNHPLIVHLPHQDAIHEWAESISEEAMDWIHCFSPGPVTFVLKKKPHVLDSVTGGQDTIAIRIPSHPIAQLLLDKFGSGVAAPSANPYGYISPTRLSHISKAWYSEVGAIIDGGPCSIGIESTIIDLTEKPRICRLGFLPNKVQCLMESKGANFSNLSTTKRLPGNVLKHYSPHNQVLMLTMEEIRCFLIQSDARVSILSFESPQNMRENIMHWIEMHKKAKKYSYELYDSLRKVDKYDKLTILVEKPPFGHEWLPIHDRLNRAAAL